MKKATKLYSTVLKMTVLGVMLASASVSAKSMSENQKFVLGNLRLSLWYQGLDTKIFEESENIQVKEDRPVVEELDRAMMRFDIENSTKL